MNLEITESEQVFLRACLHAHKLVRKGQADHGVTIGAETLRAEAAMVARLAALLEGLEPPVAEPSSVAPGVTYKPRARKNGRRGTIKRGWKGPPGPMDKGGS